MEYKPKLQIPVDLAWYVIVNRLEKAFQVYIALLASSDGRVSLNSTQIKTLPQWLKKDGRTIDKYLKELIGLNWVGFDPKRCVYHIRSLEKTTVKHGLSGKKAGKFFTKNILQLKAFLVAVVISEKVNKRKAAKFFARRQSKSVTVKRDVALQDWTASSCNNYVGISLAEIADIFKCSHGQACNLKTLAEKAGFIIANNKFEVIAELDEADYRLRGYNGEVDKWANGKIRFKKSNGKVLVLIQLMDEIIPLVQIVRVRNFKGVGQLNFTRQKRDTYKGILRQFNQCN